MIDEYEDDPGRAAKDKKVVCYGQVGAYIHVTLPAEPRIGTNRNSDTLLALVTLCKTNEEDASLKLVWYTDMELVRAFDIATLCCVVGRIKINNCWGIIDWSFGSHGIEMKGMWEPEYESEDDND